MQIGGPAGAFIVIVYGIVERYGFTNLLIATAAAGVAIVYGPRMSNFRDICRGLEQAKAALKAKDAHDLAALLSRLSADDVTRAAMGRHGEVWHQGNRGATERTLTWLQDDQSAR